MSMSTQTSSDEAIAKQNKEKILDLLREGFFKEFIDVYGVQTLPSVLNGKKISDAHLSKVLVVFVDHGIDISVMTSGRKTYLDLAIEGRMRNVIDSCLRRGADTNMSDSDGNTFAHLVIREERTKYHSLESLENESASFVDYMVSKGFDFFYARNKSNHSALHLASELDLQHIFFTLLKRIIDWPSIEKNQMPLIRVFLRRKDSSYYGSIRNSRHVYNIVKMILEKSTSINDRTLTECLQSAFENNLDKSVIDMLLQRIDRLDAFFNVPLLQAFTSNFLTWDIKDGRTILRMLVLKGADLNEQDENGKSLLHLAVKNHYLIELLIKSGANVKVEDKMGETPLHSAMKKSKSYLVVKILLSAGAYVDAQDKSGNTPLSDGSWPYKSSKTIEEILKFGADIFHPKVLEQLREHSREPDFVTNQSYEYLKQHLCKMDAAKILDNFPLQPSAISADWLKFKSQYTNEVEKLKTYMIDSHTSLYDLLHKNRDRRCAFVNNEKLKNLVEDVEIENKFPHYFVLILGCTTKRGQGSLFCNRLEALGAK